MVCYRVWDTVRMLLMIDDSLNKIENVLKAVIEFQKTSYSGDFEGRASETRLPDIEGALNAVNDIRKELKQQS